MRLINNNNVANIRRARLVQGRVCNRTQRDLVGFPGITL